MMIEKDNMTLEQIRLNLVKALDLENKHALSIIDLIYLDDYLELREKLNQVFCVGDIESFKGFVSEDTEFGDINDYVCEILKERYPAEEVKGRPDLVSISFEDRKSWRDQLISELDEMVEREF